MTLQRNQKTTDRKKLEVYIDGLKLNLSSLAQQLSKIRYKMMQIVLTIFLRGKAALQAQAGMKGLHIRNTGN